MKLSSKIVIGITIFLTALSIIATFYKTVILQDFKVEGAYIEFSSTSSSNIWFYYDHQEYELTLETVEYNEILYAVAEEIGVPVHDLDRDFIEYLKTAFEEGEVLESSTSELN